VGNYASLPLRTHERPVRRSLREDFALNLSAKRCLCNTVGERVSEGASRWCAVSIARSRAVAMTNLARSNHSLVLRALFGGAKRSTLVNIFMICPRWPAGESRPGSNSASNRGHLMARRTDPGEIDARSDMASAGFAVSPEVRTAKESPGPAGAFSKR
jgi:hypothetical protein